MKICKFCKKDFTPKDKYHPNRGEFCSRKCADTFRLGKKFKLSLEAIEKIRKWHTGYKFSDSAKQKMSNAKIGKKQTPEQIEKRTAQIRVEKSTQWKGGYQNKLMHIKKEE